VNSVDSHDRADAYLTISPQYAERLGGLHWSSQREAIVHQDGSTLLLAEELTAILEGVFSREKVVPFAFVLTLIHYMKQLGWP
jgi:hypothetical protein